MTHFRPGLDKPGCRWASPLGFYSSLNAASRPLNRWIRKKKSARMGKGKIYYRGGNAENYERPIHVKNKRNARAGNTNLTKMTP
jgi:hypothetical protein